MKTLLFGLCLLLSGFAATAQDSLAYRSGIRIQYGGAYPTGDFNNTNFEEDYPPFAKEGSMFQVSYLRSIKERLFAGATLAWRRNTFDMDKFADPADELVTDKSSKPWQSVFVMADAEYRFIARDGFFYVKGSLGSAFSRSARLQVNTLYGTINRPADNGFAFAYGLHSGVQVDLNQFGIGFETGVISTRSTFEITDAQGKTTRYKQTMATINCGLFANYSF
ncbi:outer membrane beta-barrel protein [Pontibacter fetidus]|uniref:Outer membrane beta-barrel protein n=1 Tax=Pontibacter fetidus TaxID=2700082 RepID=A0A6B2H7J1_9BACT|nr:outer membrane beta-barrel protein [Pontibacter fetidus]NDK55262.1 outer membrane beta-barrel protein [Pontibacter fetidus]